MSSCPIRVLILCTGNSCRSILGEALINHLGAGRLEGYSAGSHPVGEVNPNALATLARHGLPVGGYSSKSWDALENIPFDLLISVCDSAAGEACPVYLGQVARGHWGLPDPAQVTGTAEAVQAAFDHTCLSLERRIRHLLALPLEDMSPAERVFAINRIGQETA